mmetsp:Transcript_24671/g.50837  ORF Transcript_24671/g.50837 Transcript_24671/m.50837 type:complete len:720 (-) Transcript_24671:113-2272(-)
MLDLILLGSSVVLAKRISPHHYVRGECNNRNHLASPSLSPPSPGRSSLHRPEKIAMSNLETNQSEFHQIYRISSWNFRACFVLSLWLFSLSILEAAPTSWLVIIDQPHNFVQLYRVVFWSLIILLLVVIPSLLGIAFVLATFPSTSRRIANITPDGDDKPDRSSFTTANTSKLKSLSEVKTREDARRCKHPLQLFLKISSIVVHFFVVASWFLLRRILRIIIPSSVYSTFVGRTRESSAGVDRRGSRNFIILRSIIFNIRRQRTHYLTLFLAAFGAVILSSMLMGSVMKVIIYYPAESTADVLDRNNFIAWFRVKVNTSHRYLLKCSVAMVCSFGMIIASTLNGFGSASLPHSNLLGKFLNPTCCSVLAKVEEDYHFTVKILEEKRLMLDDLKCSAFLSTSESRERGAMAAFQDCCRKTDTHILHTIQSPVNSVLSEKKRIQALREEISFLENLVGDLGDDIEEMKHSQQLALSARTPFGRVRGILGMVFSVVLVVRVALATFSSAFIFASSSTKTQSEPLVSTSSMQSTSPHSNSTNDPLTITIMWLIGHDIVSQRQYDLVLQGTSLLLAGILSISQVRNFLRVVSATGRKLSRIFGTPFALVSAGVSSPLGAETKSKLQCISLLVASFIMGSYFCACVVTMKMILPIEYRSSFSSAVGNLDFELNTDFLNMTFASSACTSALLLGFLFGIQRNNTERYQMELQLSSFSATSQSAQTA